MGKAFDRAVIFATIAHEGQFRKGTEIPYILHPVEAAAIVGTMTSDEAVLAAAVLHDTLEDTDTTAGDIADLFGTRIARLVQMLSEQKRRDLPAAITWKIRKQETLEHLAQADADVQMITLGDKLSNIRAIRRDYEALGDALWQRFNQKDKLQHKWYYEGIAAALWALREEDAYKEYCALVQQVFSP